MLLDGAYTQYGQMGLGFFDFEGCGMYVHTSILPLFEKVL